MMNRCTDMIWPGGARFALFLSHDIDSVHDREAWRLLQDVNHIRKMLFQHEPGCFRMTMHRILRAALSPKSELPAFENILQTEAKHGFRSTFFLMHDTCWARYGARYRLTDPEVVAAMELVKAAGCEIGLHGSYYSFKNADAYRQGRIAIESAFGTAPAGVRNHYLQFSGPETWRAQAQAGFSYDATFGHRDRLGPREGHDRPFWGIPPDSGGQGGLVELPLTVMDINACGSYNLDGRSALDSAWAAITPVIAAGGLVTLLWHNNGFDEPERRGTEWVYGELLDRLAEVRPWCATGREIAEWWRAKRN